MAVSHPWRRERQHGKSDHPRRRARPDARSGRNLDKRRQWGLTFQVIAGQFAFFAVLLTLWTGQDLTYSPGWMRPMFYLNVLTGVLAVTFGLYGTWLKRGAQEF